MIKLFDCFHTFVTTHEFLNRPEALYLRLTRIDVRNNVADKYDNAVGNLANHGSDKFANAKITTNILGDTVTATLRAIKNIKTGDPIITTYGDCAWTRSFQKAKRANAKRYPNLLQGTKSRPKKRKKAQ
jgi:hypothetical protein